MTGKSMKMPLCMMLVLGLIFSSITGFTSQAAKKAKLKTKKMSLTVGQKKKITIKGKKKKAKYSFSSSSSAKASVSKSGLVKAKKPGKATITVKEKYKKKTRKLGKVTVQIKAKKDSEKETQAPAETTSAVPAPSSSPAATSAPSGSPATPEPSEQPGTAIPSAEPSMTAVPTEEAKPTIKPITPYVQDTNYDVPDGFMDQNASVAGKVENISYESTVIKEGDVVTRKAKVVLPKDYSTEKKYPVVYMQHGIFGNETSMYNDHVQNVIWNAIANGDAEEMIVVFPNACANETGGSVGGNNGFNVEHYAAYNNFLNDLKECLMPYINEHYSTLTGRENTAICGFSMGGRVSLHIGFTLQDMFRYVGAFCPAPGILKHSDNGVNEPGLFQPDTFTLQDKYMNDTLVLIAAGTNDNVVKDFPKTYHETLEKNGVPHIYFETKGGDSKHPGTGGHDGTVYKYGLYNFLRRIFHLYD